MSLVEVMPAHVNALLHCGKARSWQPADFAGVASSDPWRSGASRPFPKYKRKRRERFVLGRIIGWIVKLVVAFL